MAVFFKSTDQDFASRLTRLLELKRETNADLTGQVRDILNAVRHEGDAALARLSLAFDQVDYDRLPLRLSAEQIKSGFDATDEKVRTSLSFAWDRIVAHHTKQLPQDLDYKDTLGVRMGTLWRPIDAVGLYVPGGTAAYPSSVLMNAAPAKVAGVDRIAMAVPTPNGQMTQAVLAAAHIAGINEIYRMGGAQAVAALAYGTESVVPVDKIVGPGNAYVAAAKREVFGTVGIDMVAGPSEVLIIADDGANIEWLAADLLAQAEHDKDAQSIVLTTSQRVFDEIGAVVQAQLKTLPRQEIARASWAGQGGVIKVRSLDEAVDIANKIAPEHLELGVNDPETLLDKVRHAGSIFMGHHTPEVLGDYVAGPNHVLPTARSARFASGLSVYDFLKCSSLLQATPQALVELGQHAMILAQTEGLDAHVRSIQMRTNKI